MSLVSSLSDLSEKISEIKTSFINALAEKGVTATETNTLTELVAKVNDIEQGGGGSEDIGKLIDRSITSVTIPSSVTKIGNYAFYNFSGLKSITIPNSVTSIGDYAFQSCSGLTSITIPNSVTSIGTYTFSNCYSLTSVTFEQGSKVYYIRAYAFQACSGLTSITIPSSVTSIGIYVFYQCKNLTSVTIPSSVTSISQYAFAICSKLKDIYCYATTAPTVTATTFGNSTSNYCGYTQTETKTLHVPQGATGYDSSYWSSVLLSSTKCKFTISYDL